MTDDSETILRIVSDETLASEWELVLLAQGLSPKIHRTRAGIALTVPSDQARRALAGIAADEKENLSKAQQKNVSVESMNLPAGIVVGLLLLGFFVFTVAWNSALLWTDRGSADARLIIDGQLWRTVTALTLHADVAHAVSNAVAIAVFFSAASGQLGVGVAAALVLLAGAAGNLGNAFLQGSPHDSLGASTSIFGAVGILGSLALIRRRRAPADNRRAWISIAAALALLGMLGAGGGRVDVTAHLLGFLTGAVLGVLMALVISRPLGLFIQWISGGFTFAVIVYCWALALR
jgi:membrane associated rhomboid family serine protease